MNLKKFIECGNAAQTAVDRILSKAQVTALAKSKRSVFCLNCGWGPNQCRCRTVKAKVHK
jgi:hypothetical protein